MLTASEVEFLAEDELITIVPSFRMEALQMIGVGTANYTIDHTD